MNKDRLNLGSLFPNVCFVLSGIVYYTQNPPKIKAIISTESLRLYLLLQPFRVIYVVPNR